MSYHGGFFTKAAGAFAVIPALRVDAGAQRTTQEPAIGVGAGGVLDEPGVAAGGVLEDTARTFAHPAARGLLGAGVLGAKNRTALVRTAGATRVPATDDVASRVRTAGVTHATNVARTATALGLTEVIARA